MKDTTIVVVALTVAGIFASALIIPQFIVSQSASTWGSGYYQNINPDASRGMMPGNMMSPGMMQSMMGMMGEGMMPGGMPMMPPSTYRNYTSQGMGMMGGMPMMRGMMGYYSNVSTPLSHNDAKSIVREYLASINNPDLVIDETEEYSHNFYISLVEKSTGKGAFEIIVDRYSGAWQLEPQSMMWNAKYGMVGSSQRVEMNITSEQARKIAQDFLDIVYSGTEVDEMVAYYGYYTMMTKLNGEHYGMLSVNGYTGEVWYHTWHGMFISEVE